jgi:hypothetical protein
MRIDTQAQVKAAERVLLLSWVIVFGAVLFSVLTVTPLVERVTPARWHWTAPILPVVVDAAVVIVVRVGAIVARLGGRPGGWPAVLRWLTGVMTLALNVGNSALTGDLVGVGVHMVAPTLLIVTAEASLKWRQTITESVTRIERERADERERERREQREREDRSRADREREQEARRLERERAEAAERERRREDAAEREREREHAAQLDREQREHAARLEREREERADARRRDEQERADRERREEAERKERERKAREAAERPKAAVAVSTPRPAVSTPVSAVSATVSTPAHETAHEPSKGRKMSEAAALKAVAEAVREGRRQREVVALTGWSTGWVAKRFKELEQVPGQLEMDAA